MIDDHSSTVSVEYNLRYLHAGLNALEDYLTSNMRSWQLDISAYSGEPPYPLLTPGSLLLCEARLCPQLVPNERKAEFADLTSKKETLCHYWHSAWEKKLVQEFPSILSLWQNYLEDYHQDTDQAAYYPYEVNQRVTLHLLQNETSFIPQTQLKLLDELDLTLQNDFLKGDFIWEHSLSVCFPSVPYWYLYGKLRTAWG